MTIVNMQQANSEKKLTELSYRQDANSAGLQTVETAITHTNPTTQLLLATKPTPHRQEAGLNSLVDAAAYLFSTMGKLKQLKSYNNLQELHTDLVKQIELYQQAICAFHYNKEVLAEYIPITTYALCATLDDIVASTPWGGQHQWDEYSLVVTFNQESLSQKSFFIILERLVRDPAIYIDVMEFMYICLSLGFQCHYHSNLSRVDHEQLEQITNALYKRIRGYRGNFSKTLSPFSIKAPVAQDAPPLKQGLPKWIMILAASALLLALFVGGKMFLEQRFDQTYATLTKLINT